MLNKYSLWLMPTGESQKVLTGIIKKLSREYSAPLFKPHISLLKNIETTKNDIESKTKELGETLKPFKVKLGKVEYADEYFRSLFLKVESNPQIMYANAAVRKLFSRESDPSYSPHLSLMYGDFIKELKEKIIREIGREFDLSFEAHSLHIYSSDPEVKNWRKIKEYPITA